MYENCFTVVHWLLDYKTLVTLQCSILSHGLISCSYWMFWSSCLHMLQYVIMFSFIFIVLVFFNISLTLNILEKCNNGVKIPCRWCLTMMVRKWCTFTLQFFFLLFYFKLTFWIPKFFFSICFLCCVVVFFVYLDLNINKLGQGTPIDAYYYLYCTVLSGRVDLVKEIIHYY